jgi:hypothetical protein
MSESLPDADYFGSFDLVRGHFPTDSEYPIWDTQRRRPRPLSPRQIDGSALAVEIAGRRRM